MNRFTRWALLVALALVWVTASAVADTCTATTCTYTLNNPNAALSAVPGPYGSLTVTWLDNTTAEIAFQSFVGAYEYFFGDGGAVGLNTHGAATVVGGFIFGTTPTGHNAPAVTVSYGTQNVDGQGDFNLVLTNFDGFKYSFNQVTFDIHLESGTWADAAAILMANDNGNYAEAHIFTGTLAGADTGITGYTGTGNGTVPEPASLTLFGSGLIALASIARRQQRRKL